jgi:hypothetical protein
VELYIKNIIDRFGAFEYSTTKINYDPRKEEEQIKILYPKVGLTFVSAPSYTKFRPVDSSD